MNTNAATLQQRGGARDRTKLFLIDDHPIVEAGLSLVLKRHPDLHLAGSCSNPNRLLVEGLEQTADVFVLDLVYLGAVNIDAIRNIRKHAPGSIIVVYSSLPSRQYKPVVTAAGANEFVSKDSSLGILVSTIRDIVARQKTQEKPHTLSERDGLDAGIVLPPAAKVIGDVHLTRRERLVARLLGQGVSVAQIGETIGISKKTAAVHRDNIRRKLNCRDSNELIARLSALGFESDVHLAERDTSVPSPPDSRLGVG